jgi:aminoglycoside phosphotransferase family enzyme
MNSVASKWRLDLTKAKHVLQVPYSRVEVKFDNRAIEELSEGQDMILEISQGENSQVKRQGDCTLDNIADTDKDATETLVYTDGYELRLFF